MRKVRKFLANKENLKEASRQRNGDASGGVIDETLVETFVNNRLLIQHKKDHQNLRCPSCINTFTSKRNLNCHIKVVHKPEQQNNERQSQEDSLNFVPARQIDVEELLNLSKFDLEGAVVLPFDSLTS